MQAIHLPPLETASSKPRFSFSNPSNPAAPSDLVYTASPAYPIPDFETHPAPQYYEYRTPNQPSDPAARNPQSEPLYLIRVHTTALTKGELTWVEVLLPSRFSTVRGPIPGHDVVGVVEKVYQSDGKLKQKPKFQIGDLVWGLIDFEYDGAAAGYVIAREGEISLAPNMPGMHGKDTAQQMEEILATIPLSALTAWQALFDYGGITEPNIGLDHILTQKPNQGSSESFNILITGSSGSVGVFAVQLAHLAATSSQHINVIAISSEANAQFVKDLGADRVVVYTRSKPDTSGSTTEQSKSLLAKMPSNIDLILDLTGPANDSTLLSVLQSSEISISKLVSIAGPIDFSSIPGLSTERKAALQAQTNASFFIVKPDSDQLAKLGTLVEAGLLRGFVDQVFPLEKGRAAMEYVESRQKLKHDNQGNAQRPRRGKVVLKV